MEYPQQTHLIERWLHKTTESFDDWDWDGSELVIFLDDEAIERYSNKDLKKLIENFNKNSFPVLSVLT